MAEATHSAEAIFALGRAVGRGPRLWAGKITVSNGETLDTGLDKLYAAVVTPSGTNFSITNDTFDHVDINDVSGGTITFNAAVADITAGSEDLTAATDTVAYVIAVGVVR